MTTVAALTDRMEALVIDGVLRGDAAHIITASLASADRGTVERIGGILTQIEGTRHWSAKATLLELCAVILHVPAEYRHAVNGELLTV